MCISSASLYLHQDFLRKWARKKMFRYRMDKKAAGTEQNSMRRKGCWRRWSEVRTIEAQSGISQKSIAVSPHCVTKFRKRAWHVLCSFRWCMSIFILLLFLRPFLIIDKQIAYILIQVYTKQKYHSKSQIGKNIIQITPQKTLFLWFLFYKIYFG